MKVVNNKKAFTLVELLAVIVIIGILGALIIPNVSRYIDSSKKGTYNASIIQYAKYVKAAYPDDYTNTKGTFLHTLSDIEQKSGSKLKSPYGDIDTEKSFFIVDCLKGNCKTLVQVVDNQKYGVLLTDIDDIDSSSIKKNDEVELLTSTELIGAIIDSDGVKKIERCDIFAADKYYLKDVSKTDITTGIRIGDVNLDGSINSEDSFLIFDNTDDYQDFSQKQKLAADVNCDGRINVSDASMTNRFAIGTEKKLPSGY